MTSTKTIACIVCGAYIGGAGPREGQDVPPKRCFNCADNGRVPEGYEMKNGSIIPKK